MRQIIPSPIIPMVTKTKSYDILVHSSIVLLRTLGSSRNEKSLRSNGLHELERHSTPTHNFKGPKTRSTKGQGATHDSICNGGEGAYWEGVDRNVWAYRTACLFHSGSVVLYSIGQIVTCE